MGAENHIRSNDDGTVAAPIHALGHIEATIDESNGILTSIEITRSEQFFFFRQFLGGNRKEKI